MEDKSKEQNEQKPKISKKDFVLMLIVAILFDVILALIQLIPFAGSVAAAVFNVIPFIGFFIWYKLLGLDFKNPKKAFTFLGGSFIEFIPAINILPAWTASIVIMYILQKKDVIFAKAVGLAGGAAGATAIASAGAKMVGAKNLGKNLKGTSEKLREKSNEFKNRITPIESKKNPMVGAEISKIDPKTQEEELELGRSVSIQNGWPGTNSRNIEPLNATPFSKSIPHDKAV